MTLKEFFDENRKVALAFSGGSDSSFLLYKAIQNGIDIKAYFVSTEFQPQFEVERAEKIAKDLNANFEVIFSNVMGFDSITENRDNRCYLCKKNIIREIKEKAEKDGYEVIIDGTNASDSMKERPGIQAGIEAGVISPLVVCGLKKDKIRQMATEENAPAALEPSYSCLATRIRKSDRITLKKLAEIERVEIFLRNNGFGNFRFRISELKDNSEVGILEIDRKDLSKLARVRNALLSDFAGDFDRFAVDLKFR